MRLGTAALAAALALGVCGSAAAQSEKDMIFIPVASYWTGAFGAAGSAFGGGMIDYYKMLNARDGGINGVKIFWEKCETNYQNDRTVECYERMKARGPGASLFHPLTTGGTYALIERTQADKIALMTLGYGRTDTSDGRVFPYVFPMLTNYWSQNTAKIAYIAGKAGGYDKLKGMKIANLHFDGAAGKETIPVLDKLAEKYGFEVKHFPVALPGLDQKAVWLQIARQFNPDWVLVRGWGVMNPTTLKEAQRIGFPREKMIGFWWSGSEEDVVPAGDAAEGFTTAGFHAAGLNFPAIQDIIKHVYDKNEGELPKERLGSVYYNRAVVFAIVNTEAIRDAMAMTGQKRAPTGEELQRALEKFEVTEARLDKLGAKGLMPSFKLSCKDHEGGAPVKFQQWKGGKWVEVSDWIKTDQSVVRPMIEASAAAYAKEKNITPRTCN